MFKPKQIILIISLIALSNFSFSTTAYGALCPDLEEATTNLCARVTMSDTAFTGYSGGYNFTKGRAYRACKNPVTEEVCSMGFFMSYENYEAGLFPDVSEAESNTCLEMEGVDICSLTGEENPTDDEKLMAMVKLHLETLASLLEEFAEDFHLATCYASQLKHDAKSKTKSAARKSYSAAKVSKKLCASSVLDATDAGALIEDYALTPLLNAKKVKNCDPDDEAEENEDLEDVLEDLGDEANEFSIPLKKAVCTAKDLSNGKAVYKKVKRLAKKWERAVRYLYKAANKTSLSDLSAIQEAMATLKEAKKTQNCDEQE